MVNQRIICEYEVIGCTKDINCLYDSPSDVSDQQSIELLNHWVDVFTLQG